MDIVERLRAAGCVFAEEEAALLVDAASGAALEALVERRIAGEPLEHLLGFVDFRGRRYRLSRGVFVPRQRSALLVDEAIRLASGDRAPVVVDLCCGCGALGLAVREAVGGDLYAADIDPAAVDCARSNGVTNTHLGDLFAPLPAHLRGRIDLLLVNTPYVPTAVIAEMPSESRDHEPRTAVDGGADGMDVQRRVLAAAPEWLSRAGRLLTETSTSQADTLTSIAEAAGLSPRIVHDDDLGATVLVATAAR